MDKPRFRTGLDNLDAVKLQWLPAVLVVVDDTEPGIGISGIMSSYVGYDDSSDLEIIL